PAGDRHEVYRRARPRLESGHRPLPAHRRLERGHATRLFHAGGVLQHAKPHGVTRARERGHRGMSAMSLFLDEQGDAAGFLSARPTVSSALPVDRQLMGTCSLSRGNRLVPILKLPTITLVFYRLACKNGVAHASGGGAGVAING